MENTFRPTGLIYCQTIVVVVSFSMLCRDGSTSHRLWFLGILQYLLQHLLAVFGSKMEIRVQLMVTRERLDKSTSHFDFYRYLFNVLSCFSVIKRPVIG